MTRKEQVRRLLRTYTYEELALNPYYESLQNADWANRSDLQDNFLDWEATQRYYQQQLADQRALRDEERAYNDPSRQVERLRAAGINPDLDGSSAMSGSGSSGGSSVPATSQWKGQPESDKVESVQALAGTVQSFVSSMGQLGQLANTFVDFSKNVSLYDNSLAIGSAAARQATYGADLSKLSMIGKYAEFLPQEQDLSDIDIDKFAKDMFINDPEIVEGLKHYVSSPTSQKIYYDRVRESREAFEKHWFFNPEYVGRTLQLQQRSDYLEASTREILSSFLNSYNESYYGDTFIQVSDDGETLLPSNNEVFARQLGSAARESAFIESADNLEQQKFTAKKNKRSREIFTKQLSHVAEFARHAKKEADSLLSDGLTEDEWPLYASHVMTYSRMLTLGNDVLNQVYDQFEKYAHRIYMGDAMLDDGDVSWVDTELLTHRLDYANRIFFSDIINSDNTSDAVESVFSKLTDFAKQFVKGKTKTK